MMRRFTENDSTRLWELLNGLAQDGDNAFALLPKATAGGRVSIAAGGLTTVTYNLVFPAGRFTSAVPILIPMIYAAPNTANIVYDGVSAAGARFVITRDGGGAFTTGYINVAWIAAEW